MCAYNGFRFWFDADKVALLRGYGAPGLTTGVSLTDSWCTNVVKVLFFFPLFVLTTEGLPYA